MKLITIELDSYGICYFAKGNKFDKNIHFHLE